MTNGIRAALVLAAGLAIAATTGCGSGHGKYTTAEKEAAQQRLAEMKSATTWEMAHQAYLSGDLEKALKRVDESITLNPDVSKSHVLRGRILMEQGRLEEAMTAFNKAIGLDAESVDAAYFTGVVHERFLQTEEALACYLRAATLDTTNPQYPLAAAEMYVDLGALCEAEEYLTQRVAMFQHNAGIRQTLGHVALMQGRAGEAVELFNEARLLAPEDSSIVEDLVQAQMEAGDYAGAEYNLTRLREQPANAGRRDLQHLHAQCYLRVDRLLEARELLIELTSSEEGQSDTGAWIELGELAFRLKDMGRLFQSANRVVALAPDRCEGYVLRAMWYRRKGDANGALVNLDKAVGRRDGDWRPLVLRGIVLQDLGREDEARVCFATALDEQPTASDAQRLRQALDERSRLSSVPDGGE